MFFNPVKFIINFFFYPIKHLSKFISNFFVNILEDSSTMVQRNYDILEILSVGTADTKKVAKMKVAKKKVAKKKVATKKTTRKKTDS